MNKCTLKNPATSIKYSILGMFAFVLFSTTLRSQTTPVDTINSNDRGMMAVCAATAVATPSSVCTGSTSVISLSGATFGIDTYQWQQNVNGGGWVNVVGGSGGTTNTYTTPALTSGNTYQYRCAISDAPSSFWCTAGTSSSVSITPSAAATVSAAGGDQSVCVSTATLAGNTPGVGTGAWSKISGSGTITTPTSPTSGLTALSGASTFRWTITNGACTSTDDVIITNGDLSSALAYKNTNCPASTTSAVLTVSPSTGSLQWQENINGAGWNNIVGATTTPYSVSGIDATYTFRVNITTGCGTYTINAASTVTSLSFIDYSGGFGSSYATYNAAGNCYSNLTAGQTYCYAFIYSHFIELNWMTNGCSWACPNYSYTKLFSGGSSVATSTSCGGSVSSNVSGNCAEATINCDSTSSCNPIMYDNACGVVQTNGVQFGSGCAAPAMTEGNVYYICFTVPAGCGGMNMCPMMKCETGNCAASPLPIELLYFNATAVEGKVQLHWATETETNNDYFSIERTTDGIHFELVAEVDGAGNSTGMLNYSLVDETPLKGLSYYRLRQTDYDGKVGYSKLASVELANESPLKLIYVSPNQDKNTLQYQFSYTQEKPLKVEVIDVVGKTIYSEKVSSDANGQTLNIDASGLSKGIYLIKISDGMYSEIKKFVY